MKKNDCINDCVGPDCEGCRNYKTMKALSEQIREILKENSRYIYDPELERTIYAVDDCVFDDVACFITSLIEQNYVPKEFVEWYITEGQFNLRTVGVVMNPLAEALNYWKENIKDK